MNRVKRDHATAPSSECTQKGLRHLKVTIVVLLNVQFDEVGEFSQGVNGPSKIVVEQNSACGGQAVWVETGRVSLLQKGFVPIYYLAFNTRYTGKNGAH